MARLAVAVQATASASLSGPLVVLGAALQDLSRGETAPVLRPQPKRGRAPASLGRQKLMRAAADMVALLRTAGVAPRDAEAMVATELDRAGFAQTEGGATIQASTIRHWCGTAAAPSPHMAALEIMRLRGGIKPPEGMTAQDARAVVRDMAAKFARDPNLPRKPRS